MLDKKTLLSVLWIFLVVNFLFCDIFTLMHAPDLQRIITGVVDGVELTQGFLLAFAVLMEISMAMILLSQLLPRKANRIANMVGAIILLIIHGWTLTSGEITLHYWFFSIIEMGTMIAILIVALRWNQTTQNA